MNFSIHLYNKYSTLSLLTGFVLQYQLSLIFTIDNSGLTGQTHELVLLPSDALLTSSVFQYQLSPIFTIVNSGLTGQAHEL